MQAPADVAAILGEPPRCQTGYTTLRTAYCSHLHILGTIAAWERQQRIPDPGPHMEGLNITFPMAMPSGCARDQVDAELCPILGTRLSKLRGVATPTSALSRIWSLPSLRSSSGGGSSTKARARRRSCVGTGARRGRSPVSRSGSLMGPAGLTSAPRF